MSSNFQLAQIQTRDKLLLHGVLFKPVKSSDKILIWIHGLGGNFYGGIKRLDCLAELCDKEKIGLASFNTRGHDIITGIKKIDKRKKKGYTRFPGGCGQEVFEQCVFDLEAMIRFLVEKGY